MTSISGAFSTPLRYNNFQNSTAIRLLSGGPDALTNQSQVDEIVNIIQSSEGGKFEIKAEFNGAVIDATDDDESNDSDIAITTYSNATIRTGGGTDNIDAQDNAVIDAGSGDDHITTYRNSTVHAGAGDDFVSGYYYMTVDADAGNDHIRTLGHATIDAGKGDDLVVTLGHSTVTGGGGNDILIAGDNNGDPGDVGYTTLHGGEGDDDIQIGRDSVASGGIGNDRIALIREGSTVEFAKGDGKDTIFSEDDFALAISGYSKDDVTVVVDGNDVVVSFAGSDDAMKINLRQGKVAALSFADGSKMTIEGANRGETFMMKTTMPQWKERYSEHLYSRISPAYTLSDEYSNRRSINI